MILSVRTYIACYVRLLLEAQLRQDSREGRLIIYRTPPLADELKPLASSGARHCDVQLLPLKKMLRINVLTVRR
jgi:hypothetical protein